ncbi:MAG: glycosyltransferase family 4 protein [Chloroflexi bacterium]|nr:glycosyltransferase family 4 protein [Chloroflexota bacterium]
MIIGIDASRAMRAQRTGTERYSLELINALLALDSGHTFRLYVPAPPPAGLFHPGADIVVLPGSRIWTHTRLGPHTRRYPPDVLFVPAHVLPLIGPSRTVVTVHDLGYEYFPQAHPWRQRQYLRWSTRRHARIATRIITDSQATKDDLIRFYRADPTRIHVVPLAPDSSLQPETNEGRVQAVRVSYGIPGYAEYILHIGTIHPRKNLERLVEAFAQVRRQLPERKLHLVLVGGMGHNGHKLRHKVQEMGLAPYVRFTGYARVHDIPALYTGASCYVFPSLNEGFGFPALEAQLCGTPLLCSRSSSLPEVAGEGALYFDPTNVDEMASALQRLLVEPELRSELIAKGYANVQRFSWQKTARQTLEVLERASQN